LITRGNDTGAVGEAVVQLEGFTQRGGFIRARIVLMCGGDEVVVDRFPILLLDSLNSLCNLFIPVRFVGLIFQVGRNEWLAGPVTIAVPSANRLAGTNLFLVPDSTRAEK